MCIRDRNIANPTNEKEFKKVPIQINYEGSTPERNGLMMLLSDTNLYVNMIVEGPRSRLVTLRCV